MREKGEKIMKRTNARTLGAVERERERERYFKDPFKFIR